MLPPSHEDHLSRELLAELDRGSVSAEALERVLMTEAARHCPTCRAALEAFVAVRLARQAPGAVIAFPGARRRPASPDDSPEAREARRFVAQLERLAPDHRLDRVLLSRRHLRGPWVVEAMLARALDSLPGRPDESALWAELALRTANRSEGATPALETRLTAGTARAWALLGNAARIAGDLPEADRRFERAAAIVRHESVTDLRTLAELRSLAGALRRDQRRFGEAESLLTTAAELLTSLGEDREVARTYLLLTTVHMAAGLPERMLETLAKVRPLIDTTTDRRMYWASVHNEIVGLIELCHFPLAAALLDESRSLYAEFGDPYTQLRHHWVKGLVASGLGRTVQAEMELRVTQEGFLRERSVYDAALVSLDLAILWLEQGRRAEVQELAVGMVSTFAALGIHREALAAWRLFAEAASQERATVELARRLARYLGLARRDPRHTFSPE